MKDLTHQSRRSTDPSLIEMEQTEPVEGRLSYLRPNRYFKFYLFREKSGGTTCWLPEGFCA